VAPRLLVQVNMPSGSEGYRGYAIHWDTVSAADGPWNGKAGVLCAPDISGFSTTILAITGRRFASEAGARDYVIREAKKRIDEIVMKRERAGSTAKSQVLKFLLSVISLPATMVS
jgi:uncharacterized membrane protein